MDWRTAAAAHALASGDALGALNCISLRDDPPALALRGIAMAQLDDFSRARILLRRAALAFGPHEPVARARCLVAEAEIALVSRDLTWPAKPLDAAAAQLERHGDRANAAHARYLAIRRLLLIGRLEQAEAMAERFDPAPLPAASRAAYSLVLAGIAIRRLRIKAARDVLLQARNIADRTGIASLMAEVETVARMLESPAVRLVTHEAERVLRLEEIETLFASDTLVVDACRHAISHLGQVIALDTRPVLFALARALAEVWPADVTRAELLARAFHARHADESHRARLRVEICRLRKALAPIASVEATKAGFSLVPVRASDVAVLAAPLDGAHADVLALLADGEAWSSSALALALGTSQRTVQRALDELGADGRARPVGHGRGRRWLAPAVPGFPTALLLPVAPPDS